MSRRRAARDAGRAIRRWIGLLVAGVVAAGAWGAVPARAVPVPSLSVRAADLIEASTGQRLYGVDPDRSLPIASTTKLMTALLTLEHGHLGRVLTAPDYVPAAAESQIGLVPGERMSVHDLLLAVLLPSANDAAEDLASNLGHGSVARFVGMMDARARELHLTHTHYSTPVGLDTPENYSSASDLVRLANYLRNRFPFFAHAVALKGTVLHTGNHVRAIENRNDLVDHYAWINGVKTGHTLGAGYVLVGSATRHGLTLLSAVLGTSSEAARDANTVALLDYGYANFRLAKPVAAHAVLARSTVRNEPGAHAEVIAARGFEKVITRSTRLRTRVEVPRQLSGPLAYHAVVGHVVVTADGHPIARIPLLLAHRLRAVSSLTRAARFIARPSTLVSVFVLFGAAMAFAVRRRLKTRGEHGAEPA
jgi:D-alanyl-D-alanine carboxypeptidase (penicillin-binding protein 5/6)